MRCCPRLLSVWLISYGLFSILFLKLKNLFTCETEQSDKKHLTSTSKNISFKMIMVQRQEKDKVYLFELEWSFRSGEVDFSVQGMFSFCQSILEQLTTVIVVRCRIKFKGVSVLEKVDQYFWNITITKAPLQK
jgi:hypothetical protein